MSITDELKVDLEKAGYNLKGFTFTGPERLKNLSDDQNSVEVGVGGGAQYK